MSERAGWVTSAVLFLLLSVMLLLPTMKELRARATPPRPDDRIWRTIPMSDGPSLHVACYEGNLIVQIQTVPARSKVWMPESGYGVAIIEGGCR